MNLLFVIVTAFTVSVDSLIAGFSLSLNKRKSLVLPLTVALVTYLLCTAASLAGTLLRDALQSYVKFIGAGILLCLGVVNLLKREETEFCEISVTQCFAIGFSVGLDGAVATLSLVLQGIGNAFVVPLLMALTHFVTVFAGQRLAQTARIKRANLISAVLFFVLAAIKLFEL